MGVRKREMQTLPRIEDGINPDYFILLHDSV
jgi:hypothetical protein